MKRSGNFAQTLDKVTKLIPKDSDINFVTLQIKINAIPYRSVH